MNEALYRAIADRYGFSLPEDYRRLEARGLLHLSKSAHASAFTRPGSYLWLPDMEWLSLEAIAEFQFEAYCLPGFVPFAFTAGGDHWCWQPGYTSAHGTRVVYCPHDNFLATVYAPQFAGAVYRQALAICSETDLDAPAFLRRWAADLSDLFPARWRTRLLELAESPARALLARHNELTDLDHAEIGQNVPWMK